MPVLCSGTYPLCWGKNKLIKPDVVTIIAKNYSPVSDSSSSSWVCYCCSGAAKISADFVGENKQMNIRNAHWRYCYFNKYFILIFTVVANISKYIYSYLILYYI